MKFNCKFSLAVAMMAMASSAMLVSCDDDDDDNNSILDSAKETALASVNESYVDNVVVPTYKSLADECEALVEAVSKFEDGITDAEVEAACEKWIEARKYWEWSEAFLFGAAADYAIDPHIDTWPFDETMFNTLMKNNAPTASEENKAIIDHNIATSQNLTGFHALEYLIFRDGAARPAADINADEAYFCQAVAEDLYLNTTKLQASWAGLDNVSSARQELLADAEYEPTSDYGDEFKNAGQAGSRWKTATDAAINIIEGCQDIIGEVSEAKIGSAATGEDVSYIESPNSYNSITDFYDNIISCVHAFYGSMDITKVSDASSLASATNSLAAYCLLTHSEATAEVSSKMASALLKIAAMKAPFVKYYNDESAKEAMEALDELDEAFDSLKAKLQED